MFGQSMTRGGEVGVVVVMVTLLVILELKESLVPSSTGLRTELNIEGKRGVATVGSTDSKRAGGVVRVPFHPMTIDESAVTVVEMPQAIKRKPSVKGIN